MTKKTREMDALQEIKAIVGRLGMESYIGAALAGALELAESNIEGETFDTAQYFIEKSWEQEKRAHALTKERDVLLVRLTALDNSAAQLQGENAALIAENKAVMNELTSLKVRLFDMLYK